MKVLKIIALVLVVIVGIFAIVVAMQPADFRVERKATIAAAQAKVFDEVNDFHRWQAWSPWAKRDPNAKTNFEGPDSGKGAIFGWVGNNEVGEGRMTILDSRPSELIQIKLDFIKPFESTANAEFTFKPVGEQTEVTWAMTGKNNFIGRAMCMLMNMDKMVGGDFEKGLASIKSVVETGKAP